MTDIFREFIGYSRYQRDVEDSTGKRRETWEEAVDRYFTFLKERTVYPKIDVASPHAEYLLKKIDAAQELMNQGEVVGSMRALATAGPALDRDHAAAYNCAYLPIESITDFSDLMYLLSVGAGVGYTVERHVISRLPSISYECPDEEVTPEIVVEDSKEGWQDATRELFEYLYAGYSHVDVDYSKIRPKGTPLKTFGGTASGPEPLKALFAFVEDKFRVAREAGREKFTSLEVHDMCCMIAECIVSGGVRRSALIVLFDLHDEDMLKCKFGNFAEKHPYRYNANNSAVTFDSTSAREIRKLMKAVKDSKSGEPGFFNRDAARRLAQKAGRRIVDDFGKLIEFGCNPCSEIILPPRSFCNLTEAAVRTGESFASLSKKVEAIAIMGTLQSALIMFPRIHPDFHKNCAEERLLGCSLTGVRDYGSHKEVLKFIKEFGPKLKKVVEDTNAIVAGLIGIPASKARTAIKPSGTVSLRLGTSAGMHTAYDRMYRRRVKLSVDNPVSAFFIDIGVPYEYHKYQFFQEGSSEPTVVTDFNNYSFSFPRRTPDGVSTRVDSTAVQDLEVWLFLQEFYCDHKPSCTVNVREDEWDEITDAVVKFKDVISGVAFLPYDTGSYIFAPYESIDEATYNELAANIPETVDWSQIHFRTNATKTLACGPGGCEDIDDA